VKAELRVKDPVRGNETPRNANRRLAWLEASQDLLEQESKHGTTVGLVE
jgi:hypothetical protein